MMELMLYSYGMIPVVLLGRAVLAPDLVVLPPAATVLTSMFLHGGWLHLVGNMLYLRIFGANVEDRLGRLGFLAFYLVSGAIAAATQVALDPGSAVPMIGASGAISGVLGAYLVLYPHARILVLIPISFMFLHQIRAQWLLGVWLALQVVSALASQPGTGGVAWYAHVGGFAAGAAMIAPVALLDRWRRRRRRPGPWG
jgi:membrane associated rhomboid family serine protease